MPTKLGQITYDDDDFHRGERSTEVKCGNLHAYHIWSDVKLIKAKDDDDLHGG